MNEAEERSILSDFQKTYPKFPAGKITHRDKPDFTIEGDQVIGVEITQVFKDQDSPRGSLIKAKKTFQRQLLTNIVSELRQTNFPKCIISIDLNDSVYSRRLNAKQIAKQCLNHILANQNVIQGHNVFEFTNHGKLPQVIDGYVIDASLNISNTEFLETGGAIGYPLGNDTIQFILDKKEKAKRQFKKCDAYWLLIKEGSGEADYFGSLEVEPSKLSTTFDKIFLLRHRNDEIVELK
jgi:hypothetical protein